MPSFARSVAVPSGSYRIIRAVPPPKYRNASLVAAANTASGGSPRATRMASRRSAAWVSASPRSSCPAWALAIAVATSSVNEVRRASVSRGSGCLSTVHAIMAPHRRPWTMTGAPAAARKPASRAATAGPLGGVGVAVDPGRAAGPRDDRGEVLPPETLPVADGRDGLASPSPAGDDGRRAVGPVADHRHLVGLKQLPCLLGNRSEQLVRRRSARHQRGYPPQRGLLIGKLTQPRLAGCIMALRRV